MIQERECCGTFEGTPHRTTCRPNLLKEISRLKAELAEFKQWQKEDHDKLVQQVQTIDVLEQELQKTQLQLMQEETDRKIWQQDCKKVEAQLSRYAGAVEVEGLKEELEASDWVGEQACKAIEQARKQAAREILQLLDTADWACSTYEETYYQAVAAIKSKFELEG